MSGGKPARWEDEEGTVLEVLPCGGTGHARVRVSWDSRGARVSGEACVSGLEVPEVAVALWEAAGLVPPVMLGRPPVDPSEPVTVGPFRVGRDAHEVILEHYAEGAATSETGLDPSQARQLAAVLVAYADAPGIRDLTPAQELASRIRVLSSLGVSADAAAEALIAEGWGKGEARDDD